jgi:ribosomal protein S18 acetylase RimI-like enzyme
MSGRDRFTIAGMQRDTSDIAVRRAIEQDVTEIASVLHAAFIEHVDAFTPAAFAATTPTPEQLQRRLNEGPVWVALYNSATVGTVAAVPNGAGLYIRSMAVLPIARGRGIGGLLLQHTERFAAAQGYSYVMLTTTSFLTSAIRLYEGFGFQRSDATKDFFGTALFTMVKPVKPVAPAA